MIVVTAEAELALLAFGLLLFWALYEALREQHRRAHKRHIP